MCFSYRLLTETGVVVKGFVLPWNTQEKQVEKLKLKYFQLVNLPDVKFCVDLPPDHYPKTVCHQSLSMPANRRNGYYVLDKEATFFQSPPRCFFPLSPEPMSTEDHAALHFVCQTD